VDGPSRAGSAPAVAHGSELGLPVLLLFDFDHNPLVNRRVRDVEVHFAGLRAESPTATQLARHTENTAATRDVIRTHPSTVLAWTELHHRRGGVDLLKHKGGGRET
jgi:hypothetical protein